MRFAALSGAGLLAVRHRRHHDDGNDGTFLLCVLKHQEALGHTCCCNETESSSRVLGGRYETGRMHVRQRSWCATQSTAHDWNCWLTSACVGNDCGAQGFDTHKRETWLDLISWQSSAIRPKHWIATTSLLCESGLAGPCGPAQRPRVDALAWRDKQDLLNLCQASPPPGSLGCIQRDCSTDSRMQWLCAMPVDTGDPFAAVAESRMMDSRDGQQAHCCEGTCKRMHNFQFSSVSSPNMLCTCCADMSRQQL